MEQHGTEDVLKHPKVVSKMAKPIRRTKEMLSANMDAPFIMEELFNGIDFMSSITRQEFEEIGGVFFCSHHRYSIPVTSHTIGASEVFRAAARGVHVSRRASPVDVAQFSRPGQYRADN